MGSERDDDPLAEDMPDAAVPADAAELADDFWEQGVKQFGSMVSPWHAVADAKKFGASVDRISALSPSVVATCHGPAVSGARLEQAFGYLRELPGLPPAPLPTQADLEQILSVLAKSENA